MFKFSLRTQPFTCRCRSFSTSASKLVPDTSRRHTHYDVLKLQQNCTQEQIREAYIQLSKQYHPDMQSDTIRSTAKMKEMSAMFSRINEAYQTLGKPSSRRDYDAYLSGRPSPMYNQRPRYSSEYSSGYRHTSEGFHYDRAYWEARNRNAYWRGRDPFEDEAAEEIWRRIQERRRNGLMLCVYIIIFSAAMHIAAYTVARELAQSDQEERRRRYHELYDPDEQTHRSRLYTAVFGRPSR